VDQSFTTCIACADRLNKPKIWRKKRLRRPVQDWASFRGDCSVSTWLFCIARNTYIDSTRRPGAARIDTNELLAIPDRDGACDPAHHYAAREQRDAINLALTQLPEKYRSVLLLRDQEGLSYAEIAAILEMSLAAVKVNLFRARNAFRTIYAEINQEHEDSAE
jgi:RNA polymerase sigma-70 factor (ECF subfamily)